jgi:hypothetical protein
MRLSPGFMNEGVLLPLGVTSLWATEDVGYFNVSPADGTLSVALQIFSCTDASSTWDTASASCSGTDEVLVEFIPGVELDPGQAAFVGSVSHSNPEDFTTTMTLGSGTVSGSDLVFVDTDTCGNGGGSVDVYIGDTSQGFAFAESAWPFNCGGTTLHAKQLPSGSYTFVTRMNDGDTGNNTGSRDVSVYIGELTAR